MKKPLRVKVSLELDGDSIYDDVVASLDDTLPDDDSHGSDVQNMMDFIYQYASGDWITILFDCDNRTATVVKKG